MKIFNKISAVAISSALLVACSTPHQIILKDGEVLNSATDPEYDVYTDFYVLEQEDGSELRINRESVKYIKEVQPVEEPEVEETDSEEVEATEE